MAKRTRLLDELAKAGTLDLYKELVGHRKCPRTLTRAPYAFTSFISKLAQMDIEVCERLDRLAAEELETQRLHRKCAICSADMHLPLTVLVTEPVHCERCLRYLKYLDRFTREERAEILKNRTCICCRINKVDSHRIRSRRCKRCVEHLKLAEKGTGSEARAFFQMLEFSELARQENKDNEQTNQ